SDLFDLPFIFDANAFAAIQIVNVEQTPVQLPKMSGVCLATVLRLLLSQIKGEQGFTGTFIVRRNYIEIPTTVTTVNNFRLRQAAFEVDHGEVNPRLYKPLRFSGDERVLRDLVAYAPGLNTSQADIRAVLEAEAVPNLRFAAGAIDAAAR